MKPSRLDALADGIFAIVMTLLVIEFKLPVVEGELTNTSLWHTLEHFGPLVMSYVLSFAVLFTYWRAHHFIMGVYAKTVDMRLTNINALFFLFVAFIPFSSALLGHFSTTQLAISLYALNIILIGVTLWWMRHHVLFSDRIESVELGHIAMHHGTLRTLIPVIFAVLAIPISFWNSYVSLTLLTLAVIYNLLPWSTRVTDRLLGISHDH